MGAVFGLVKGRKRRAGDARQHPVHGFEDGDLLGHFRQHSGGFQPDIAAADDGDALRRRQFGLQGFDIGTGADGVDAGKIMAGAGQRTRRPAGGPDQRAIADAVPRRGGQRVRFGIDGGDLGAGQHGDAAIGPKAGGANQHALEFLLAGEEIFGQRRAFIGDFGFFADHRDAAGKA